RNSSAQPAVERACCAFAAPWGCPPGIWVIPLPPGRETRPSCPHIKAGRLTYTYGRRPRAGGLEQRFRPCRILGRIPTCRERRHARSRRLCARRALARSEARLDEGHHRRGGEELQGRI